MPLVEGEQAISWLLTLAQTAHRLHLPPLFAGALTRLGSLLRDDFERRLGQRAGGGGRVGRRAATAHALERRFGRADHRRARHFACGRLLRCPRPQPMPRPSRACKLLERPMVQASKDGARGSRFRQCPRGSAGLRCVRSVLWQCRQELAHVWLEFGLCAKWRAGSSCPERRRGGEIAAAGGGGEGAQAWLRSLHRNCAPTSSPEPDLQPPPTTCKAFSADFQPSARALSLRVERQPRAHRSWRGWSRQACT